MAASLAEFLATLPGRRWEWGTTDCFIVVADWVWQRRGCDPAEGWRGTYSTEEQCLALLKSAGGAMALAQRSLAGCGLQATNSPKAGDVGLVLGPTSVRGGRLVRWPVGAICVAQREWAVLARGQGLLIADTDALPLVAAWAV